MKTILSIAKWFLRFTLLPILFVVCFMAGSTVVAGLMPTTVTSEPGLVSDMSGLLIIALADVAVIAALILSSRWHGWKLALGLALAYYGAVTFVMQIETAYFLSSITVSPQLLPRLFVMGMPTAFVFIPLAVWILGKGTSGRTDFAATCPVHAPWPVDLEAGPGRGALHCALLGRGLLHRLAKPGFAGLLRPAGGRPALLRPHGQHPADRTPGSSPSRFCAPCSGCCAPCPSFGDQRSIPGGRRCWWGCSSACPRTSAISWPTPSCPWPASA